MAGTGTGGGAKPTVGATAMAAITWGNLVILPMPAPPQDPRCYNLVAKIFSMEVPIAGSFPLAPRALNKILERQPTTNHPSPSPLGPSTFYPTPLALPSMAGAIPGSQGLPGGRLQMVLAG